MPHLEIADWDKFQHYKRPNPPWIKLYGRLLDNDRFDWLEDDSKLLYFCLILFASRKKNHMNLKLAWLQKKLPIEKKLTFEMFQPLINAGFIICYNDDRTIIETL